MQMRYQAAPRLESRKFYGVGLEKDTSLDELGPHGHFVLKAVSEQRVRLNIKKATLRH